MTKSELEERFELLENEWLELTEKIKILDNELDAIQGQLTVMELNNED